MTLWQIFKVGVIVGLGVIVGCWLGEIGLTTLLLLIKRIIK
jgi:hypothetical protein